MDEGIGKVIQGVVEVDTSALISNGGSGGRTKERS